MYCISCLYSTPGIFEYLVKLRLTYSQVTSCFEDWFDQNVSSPLSSSSCHSDSMATLQDDDNPSVAISRDMIKGVMLSVQRVVERERQTKQRGTLIRILSFPVCVHVSVCVHMCICIILYKE